MGITMLSGSASDPCLVCNLEKTPTRIGVDVFEQHCKYCGRFIITGSAVRVPKASSQELVPLRGWIQSQNDFGVVPTLTKDNLPGLKSRQLPRFEEKADRLLLKLLERQVDIGVSVDLNQVDLMAACYCKNFSEIVFTAKFLREAGYLSAETNEGFGQITPKGFLKAENLKFGIGPSDIGFVAMWFEPAMTEARDKGFFPAIVDAGYSPQRVDSNEHINRVDDEIVAMIRRSRFVVADFTGHRGGVYFEAGFALGMNLPVFWTCRKDDMKDLHFDIRQYNCIDWLDVSDLRERLKNRIEAVIGRGPKNR